MPVWYRLTVAVALTGSALLQAADVAVQSVSADGRWLVSGEQSLVVVREHGQTIKTLAARSIGGVENAAVSIVRHLPARHSFLIAFDHRLPELWELSVDRDAPPVFGGLVHDYRMNEAIAAPGFLAVRRIALTVPMQELTVDAGQVFVLARLADTTGGRTRLMLVNLDVRRPIAQWEVDADPDFSAPVALQRDGRPVIELRDRRGGRSIVVDLRTVRLGYGD